MPDSPQSIPKNQTTMQNPAQNLAQNVIQSPTRLQMLISQSGFISDMDKSFLLSKLSELKPLDKLQLEKNLLSGMVPESLAAIARLRQVFMKTEGKKHDPDPITKFIQSVIPTQPKTIVSQSLLLKPNISGTPVPSPHTPNPTPAQIQHLNQFSNLDQLTTLNPAHITFSVNDPADQILDNFLKKLTQLFSGLPDMVTKRAFLMSFMQSLLFRIYISTGETALRHPELQPRNIALNQMYQIDNHKYLNKNQFQYASIILKHIRNQCAL